MADSEHNIIRRMQTTIGNLCKNVSQAIQSLIPTKEGIGNLCKNVSRAIQSLIPTKEGVNSFIGNLQQRISQTLCSTAVTSCFQNLWEGFSRTSLSFFQTYRLMEAMLFPVESLFCSGIMVAREKYPEQLERCRSSVQQMLVHADEKSTLLYTTLLVPLAAPLLLPLGFLSTLLGRRQGSDAASAAPEWVMQKGGLYQCTILAPILEEFAFRYCFHQVWKVGVSVCHQIRRVLPTINKNEDHHQSGATNADNLPEEKDDDDDDNKNYTPHWMLLSSILFGLTNISDQVTDFEPTTKVKATAFVRDFRKPFTISSATGQMLYMPMLHCATQSFRFYYPAVQEFGPAFVQHGLIGSVGSHAAWNVGTWLWMDQFPKAGIVCMYGPTLVQKVLREVRKRYPSEFRRLKDMLPDREEGESESGMLIEYGLVDDSTASRRVKCSQWLSSHIVHPCVEQLGQAMDQIEDQVTIQKDNDESFSLWDMSETLTSYAEAVVHPSVQLVTKLIDEASGQSAKQGNDDTDDSGALSPTITQACVIPSTLHQQMFQRLYSWGSRFAEKFFIG